MSVHAGVGLAKSTFLCTHDPQKAEDHTNAAVQKS